MHVDIRGGRRVISPKGIDYETKFVAESYAKFYGNLKDYGNPNDWKFVGVLEPDGKRRIYKEVTDKEDFENWLLEWSNNHRVYGDKKIVVTGEFPSYYLKVG